MKKKIISTQVWNADQSWNFKQVLQLGEHKLQISIRRNAYDFQSWARISRWNGEQWHQVHSMPITKCLCSRISYVTQNVKADTFEFDAKDLLGVATKILTPVKA